MVLTTREAPKRLSGADLAGCVGSLREACGAVMGESLYNWHVMAKRYSKYLVEKLG